VSIWQHLIQLAAKHQPPTGGCVAMPPTAIAACPSPMHQAVIHELLQLARQLHQASEYRAAAMIAERVWRLEPGNPFARHALIMARLASCCEQSKPASTVSSNCGQEKACCERDNVATARPANCPESERSAVCPCPIALPQPMVPTPVAFPYPGTACPISFAIRVGLEPAKVMLFHRVVEPVPMRNALPFARFPGTSPQPAQAAYRAVSVSTRPVHTPRTEVARQPIRLVTPCLEATCEHLKYLGSGERVLLEGSVSVKFHRADRPTQVTGQRMIINLRDGSFELQSGATEWPATRPTSAKPSTQWFFHSESGATIPLVFPSNAEGPIGGVVVETQSVPAPTPWIPRSAPTSAPVLPRPAPPAVPVDLPRR
jgi:hypothetical protein